MTYENLFNINDRLQKWFSPKSGRGSRVNRLKNPASPTKILYLWEKHTLRRIELFSME
ncbi:MAG: hypothetical protein HY746_03200 [Elusimicrobia bacterium]|nr:hypothetical protein [Elusimicrobiota bacterium]